MKNEIKNMIEEYFTDCSTIEEVAELYADIKMETQKNMEYMMKYLTKVEE
jgi:GTP-binding protein EngB required for normal cell division